MGKHMLLAVVKKKLRDKLIPSIQFLTNKVEELQVENDNKTKQLISLKSDLSIASKYILELKKEKELILESQWRTYGYKSISQDDMLKSLHTPYLWMKESPTYWMIIFSSLISLNLSDVVIKFIPKYISIHGFQMIERYLSVANCVAGIGIDHPSCIDTAVIIYDNFKKSNQKMIDYFSNKKVAIVGNGPSEIGKSKGTLIDDHDVVVRFNNYVIEPFSDDYGKRTDVWIRGSGGDDIIDREDLSQYDLIILEGDYEHFPIHFDDLNSIKRYIDEDGVECCNFDYQTHLILRKYLV